MKGAHASLNQFTHKTLIGNAAFFGFGFYGIQLALRTLQTDGRAFILELKIHRFEARHIKFRQIRHR